MIIVETIGTCERRYSSLGVKLRQVETDTLWNDAVNAIPCRFTYEESGVPVDADEPAESEDYEEALSELGVNA